LRNTSLPLDGGDGIRVMVSDPDMGLRLAVSGATPAVRAHDVVSELMAAWFTVASLPEGQRQDPATVIPIDPATEPEVLDSLVPALTAGGPVATDPSRAMVPPLEENRNGTASLVPVSSPDQGAAVLRSIGTGQLLTGYRSMFGDNDPDLVLWSQLNAQSLSVELAGPARSDLHTSIANDIEQKVRRIQTPPSRTVVLTSRNSTVPLRFRNGLPYPARIRLRIRAPRIEVKGGRTRIVTLQPGNNRMTREGFIDLAAARRAGAMYCYRHSHCCCDLRQRLVLGCACRASSTYHPAAAGWPDAAAGRTQRNNGSLETVSLTSPPRGPRARHVAIAEGCR
jgi:hypothetical protein